MCTANTASGKQRNVFLFFLLPTTQSTSWLRICTYDSLQNTNFLQWKHQYLLPTCSEVFFPFVLPFIVLHRVCKAYAVKLMKTFYNLLLFATDEQLVIEKVRRGKSQRDSGNVEFNRHKGSVEEVPEGERAPKERRFFCERVCLSLRRYHDGSHHDGSHHDSHSHLPSIHKNKPKCKRETHTCVIYKDIQVPSSQNVSVHVFVSLIALCYSPALRTVSSLVGHSTDSQLKTSQITRHVNTKSCWKSSKL